MRLDNNDTLAAHNAEYEAVHTVAYGISAEEQNDEQIPRAYANTLCNYAATKLNRKISNLRQVVLFSSPFVLGRCAGS